MVRPDPIPNSAVKHSLADGSGFIDSARVGCRQFFLKSRSAHAFRLFVFKLGHKDFQCQSDSDAGTVTLVVAVVVLPLESVTST